MGFEGKKCLKNGEESFFLRFLSAFFGIFQPILPLGEVFF